MESLNILNQIPQALYTASSKELHDLLGGPTLIDINLSKKSYIFISVLLHGNEHTGYYAIQNILNLLKQGELESAHNIILFIGNTEAASHEQRHLITQTDYNRIWKNFDGPEAKISNGVLDYISKLDLFCFVDIHNNTGKNPYYACINVIDDKFLFLAQHFFNKVVHFTEPSEVISMALAEYCPSVTLEVGRSIDKEGVSVMTQKLISLFKIDSFPKDFKADCVEVFHTVARILVSKDALIEFKEEHQLGYDLSFHKNLDDYNFKEVPAETVFAYLADGNKINIESECDTRTFSKYFIIEDKKLIVKQSFIPAMLTKDIEIIKSDCLGYIMERIDVKKNKPF